MIAPVKKISLITLTDNEPLVLEEIGKLGVVQVRRLEEAEFIGFNKIVVEDIREYESLNEKFRTLYAKFEADKTKAHEEQKASALKEKISVEELENTLGKIEQEVANVENQLKELKDWLIELGEAKPALQILKSQKINPKDLGEFKHIFAKVGIVNGEVLPKLERIVKGRKDVTYESSQISDTEVLLYISGLLDVKYWVDKALSSINFNEVKLPENIPSKIEDAIKWIDEEREISEKRIQELEKEWDRLGVDFLDKSDNLRKAIQYSLSISTAGSNILRSKLMSVFQGWVPQDKITDLNVFFDELKQKTQGQLMVWYEDPVPDEEVPTIMRNPKLFRAYEVLTRQYGHPDAKEFDPTPISTILWIVMFGMMFPDSGHGLVVLGLGILFAYILKRNIMQMNFIKIGKLMIGLGISAIIFGLLTGEFFLTEVQPLWPGLMPGWVMNPSNVIWIIKIGIFFGIAQIMLGIVISIYNHLRTGEYLDVLLGEHGIAGLVTFIGIVVVALQFLGLSIFPGIRFPKLGMDVLTHWSVFIPILGMGAIFAKPIITKEGPIMGFGLLLETVISFLANILSYSRIAGFAIAHAALALVVVELLHANPLLGIGLGLIFLNVFALTLELLVSMIQALRLLYYEFSTKFFKGTGSTYVPYKL